jgi:hypothetical protein
MTARVTKRSEPAEELRDRLRDETAASVQEALRDGSLPDAARLERLERMSRLIQLSAAARRPVRGARWVAISIVGATVLLLSILLFVRVQETGIELEVVVDELAFVAGSTQLLSDLVPARTLGLSGLRSVDLPDDGALASETVRFTAGAAGTISLGPVVAAESGRVRIAHGDAPFRFRLMVDPLAAPLDVGVHGAVVLRMPGRPAIERDFATPRGVTAQPDAGAVDIDIVLPAAVTLGSQLDVVQLSFSRIDELADDGTTSVRRVSTVRSGTLYLEELNGRALPLRAGEPIRFGAARGWLRFVQLDEDRIHVAFRGRVSGLSTGWGEAERSLMPSQLEWLRARHGLVLLWGAVLYVSGMVLTLARWWRGS